MRTSLLLVALVLAVGCGAKSGLDIGAQPSAHPRDAAVVPPIDAGARFDAGIDAAAPQLDSGFADAGPVPLLCVEAPLDAPQVFLVDFEARVAKADVVFLVDNTSSMGPLIESIEDTLQSRLIPGLAAQIPDLQMAVAVFRDFGFSPYGSPGDTPFAVFQTSTSDLDALQRAAESMFDLGGGDEPEAATEALYQLATGEGLGEYIDPVLCPDDGVGAACLRRDALPVIVVFTDAPFHNGPSFPDSYVGIRPDPHHYPDAIDALRRRGARVLGLLVGGGSFRITEADLQAVARDTGAVDADGEPIVLELGSSRRPLTRRVIDAVADLVNETTLDVTAAAEDLPGDTVDATQFVRAIVASRAVPAGGAVIRDAAFEHVTPGTRVEFRFEVANTFVEPGPVPQRFGLRLILRGEGGVAVRVRDVEVIVPARDGRGCP